MNIYHRIISSVYLRVPRHLFWCAAISFRCHARCLGLRSHAHAAAAPASYARSGLWQRTHSSICRTYAGRLCQAVDWRGAVAAPLLLAPRHGPRRHRGVHTFDSVTAAISTCSTTATSTRSPDRWRTLESVDRHGAAATRLLLAPSAWF